MTDQTAAPSAPAHPVAAPSAPASPSPEFHPAAEPAESPRSRGYRPPGSDWRERVGQQPPQQSGAPGEPPAEQEQQAPAAAAPTKIKIGDMEYAHQDVLDAIKAKAEADIRKSGLPL